jgi:sulfate adenylyltransferase subunit 2
MQTETATEMLQNQIRNGLWFSIDDLWQNADSSSKRSSLRLIQESFGALVSDLTDVRDGYGRELNKLVVPELRGWLSRKRLKVKLLQLVADGNVLAAVDFRGHAEFIGLSDASKGRLFSAIEMLSGSSLLIPHGEVHKYLHDEVRIGEHEILDAAHFPLEYTPPQSEEKSGFGEHQHLWELEQEAIHIIREAVATAEKPGMLFSMGKDSMVMLRLAEKAFAPEPVPFPLVVIDTRWKFQEMYAFRRWLQGRDDLNVIVHINPDAIERDVNPFDFGSANHTDITKTQALKQILDEHKFDFVFGGARRDEEKSRAKERVFSVRNEKHGWDPKNQRPELWDYYNTTLVNGQSMRVFPLSNWTELDVWRYLEAEGVPLVPLYFSKRRPYVVRNGSLIMVNDERFRLEEGEKVHFDPIRFRTLGCYPLTGGVLSSASTVSEIVQELVETRVSERSSRVIDFDRGASMEQKKKEGYF